MTSESLIDKLKESMGHETAIGWNDAIEYCIAIIRQHTTDQFVDANKMVAVTPESRDNNATENEKSMGYAGTGRAAVRCGEISVKNPASQASTCYGCGAPGVLHYDGCPSKPVPVSLEKCAEAVQRAMGWNNTEADANAGYIAIAVLNAAEVDYVE